MSDIVERLNRAGDLAIPGEPCAVFYDAADEIESLRLAIRRLAEQDATLSVCDGNVTVTLDATLTDAEREAIREACDEARWYPNDHHHIYALRGLLARLA
jgi:hypothetical protein